MRDGNVKTALTVAKGRKLCDKRRSIAWRDAKRDMDRRMKNAD